MTFVHPEMIQLIPKLENFFEMRLNSGTGWGASHKRISFLETKYKRHSLPTRPEGMMFFDASPAIFLDLLPCLNSRPLLFSNCRHENRVRRIANAAILGSNCSRIPSGISCAPAWALMHQEGGRMGDVCSMADDYSD